MSGEASTVKPPQKEALTPMMQQYMGVKEQYKDCLLFFRMGDFFELFLDDAVKAADILNIALTKRGKKGGNDIAMCGVPAHAYEAYLLKLIAAGENVAICDQMEDPAEAKKRGGYKAIVKREVVRVITPGTITEEILLKQDRQNFLMSIAKNSHKKQEVFALAWVDITSGEFFTQSVSKNNIENELSRLNPSEIIISDKLLFEEDLFETYDKFKKCLNPQAQNIFEPSRGANKITEFYGLAKNANLTNFNKAELAAIGAVLEYLSHTQKMACVHIAMPKKAENSSFMQIDRATRQSLELIEATTPDGYSLLQAINRCVSGSGARLLVNNLNSPLKYAEGINNRLDSVEFLIKNNSLTESLRGLIKQIPDIERLVARICMGRSSPRDLLSLSGGLMQSHELKTQLTSQQENLPYLLKQLLGQIIIPTKLYSELSRAIVEDPTAQLKNGNFIKKGYNLTLDKIIAIRDNAAQAISTLKEGYIKLTGIEKLKISHNNLIGYFIEVNAKYAANINPEHGFLHKQSMAGTMRYTTPALQELEQQIIAAKDQSLNLELEIFNELCQQTAKELEILQSLAKAIANIDFTASLAVLAIEQNYTRPQITEDLSFNIEQGRHPVIEQFANINSEFIPNNCQLEHNQKQILLTGPNMAGKSTYLRQNAIIAILAQIGSFVPAKAANIGTIDRIFSRVGASDNLSKGQSTFMTEMLETATILNHASDKSLVILDEIGRGTATYDGLSIAWAVLEYLNKQSKCRTIFATHYHELVELCEQLQELSSFQVTVKEWEDKIIFLHKVKAGAADKSYGIHVAKLSGVPNTVVKRASQILSGLEKEAENQSTFNFADIFTEQKTKNSKAKPSKLEPSKIEQELAKIDANNTTPLEALNILVKLKSLS